jgi:hypothetical protein
MGEIGGIAQWSSDQRRKEEIPFETAKDLLRLTSLLLALPKDKEFSSHAE